MGSVAPGGVRIFVFVSLALKWPVVADGVTSRPSRFLFVHLPCSECTVQFFALCVGPNYLDMHQIFHRILYMCLSVLLAITTVNDFHSENGVLTVA